MEKVIYKDDKIEFIQTETPVIFNCSHCGQMGHEAPVRSKEKKLLKSYHAHCAEAVIYRIKYGNKETISKQTLGKGVVVPAKKDLPPEEDKKLAEQPKKSYLRPVEDDELERKKNKLKSLLADAQPEAMAQEMEPLQEKVEAKPKAKIELSTEGKIFITHKYDANLIDKYHFIKQIKFNKDFKVWECDIKDADYETCRFFLKIFKDIPRFEWLISEDAYVAIKARVDWHEKNMRESKEIKELKAQVDVDIDLSHMKIQPYPYQKVGISFLNKVQGVGMLGDTMGVGKCQTPETLVYGSFGYLPIGEVFNKYAGELIETDKEGGEWYIPKTKLWTISIDEKGQQVKNPISRLYRQLVNTKLKKVSLFDGSSITVTMAHKLLGLKEWSNDFKEGEYLQIPRKIKNITNKKTIDPDLSFFLSWLISEGNESGNNRFNITQKNAEILYKIKESVLRYSLKNNIKINNPSIIKDNKRNINYLKITSVELKEHLETLGYKYGNKSAFKEIPNFILTSNNNISKIFISNFFEAEGSVNKNNSIEITSASELLIKQLSFLLRKFGIWMRISKLSKMANNGLKIKRNYYKGTIGGTSLRVFNSSIGFSGDFKQKKLSKLTELSINDNIDIIPTIDIISNIIETTKLPEKHLGINGIYKRQNLSRNSLKKVINHLNLIVEGKTLNQYKQIKHSKWTKQTLEAYNKLDLYWLANQIELLKFRLNSNSNYCKIKKIELIEYNNYVYDLTVEKDHNYIANNIYSHNTAQAIGYFSVNKLHTIIICPASLKYNWKKEIERFTDLTAVVLTEYEALDLDPKNKLADCIILNYEQLEKYDKYLSKHKFDCVVLDESQYIMNLQAKRTKAVFKYFKKCKHRLCVSGTPIKNRPIEFYAQLKFLRPDLFSNKMKFALRYCDAKETPFGWDLRGSSNLDELNRKIAPFYIRRLKQDVLKELPPKTVTVLDLEMGVTEKAEYLKIQREFDRLMNEGISQHGNTYEERRIDGAHLAKLMELKQFCSKIKVAKVVEFVKEFVESSENRKIIVFSQFIATQKALRDAFPGNSVSLLGEDSAEERNAAVEKFQSDPNIRVFVGSTIAAGVGLTLTAADTVVFADLMWSPADHEQAADRVHRISQENPVFIYYMVYKDSIESMIWAVVGHKLSVLTQTLDGKNVKDVHPDVVKMVFNSLLSNFRSKKRN